MTDDISNSLNGGLSPENWTDLAPGNAPVFGLESVPQRETDHEAQPVSAFILTHL